MNNPLKRRIARVLPIGVALCAVLSLTLAAQDSLKLMPGYDNYAKVKQQVQAAWPQVVSGAVTLGPAGSAVRPSGPPTAAVSTTAGTPGATTSTSPPSRSPNSRPIRAQRR